jgi:hypothetical protein
MRHYLFILLAAFLLAASARAADMKIEALLVRGVNDQKSVPDGKPVDSQLADKLHDTFKWKYYFQVTNQDASIPLNKVRDIRLSDQCIVSIKNLGASRVEVNCTGEGNKQCKGSYTLTPPKWLVLGGNARDDSAWFISLRSKDAK